ncbi:MULTISPECIES: winged helix-turn-helix domain-containing protein [Comamonas]|uniref:winged helix-turn-helix domain-containing protein n=1 Tax=Comamonas TaxID=283 RepID=UPI002112B359|nr:MULTISPECIES: crosslink repair DNA glycosylase YcaQ family protein [Comamonas]UUC92045.1 winged helix DNA-binding domain-containing protein [Comamonas sp. C11]WEE75551.1 winged helix DNA-binding domain-containing protein [Comamonas testosteroni]
MRWRQLALASQGLGGRKRFGKGLAGTLAAIEHLGYVQIDTLSVVERAHHHVLWNRVPGYSSQYLNQLSSAGKIFEYWFHAAAYLPMRDYRFALPRMLFFRRDESPYFRSVDKALIAEILARVRGEGMLKTRDLKESTKGKSVWWDHGPGRRALDKLFMQGDLMIRERNGMEKLYVLPEQLLSPDVNQQEPTVDEMAAYLLDSTMRAHGVFTFGQLLHLRTGKPLRNAMRELLQARLEQGAVHRLDDLAHPDTYAVVAKPRAERLSRESAEVRLLSPFDNAVIHRERLAQMFHFDYRLESYLPAAKRKYGYFCLPILWQGEFVGRIDCKADRGAARFYVHNQHLEQGWVPDTAFQQGMQNAIGELARFCGCTEVQ